DRLARAFDRTLRSAPLDRRRLPDRGRRDPRHDHQSLSLLLAVVAGGRGHEDDAAARAPEAEARTGARRAQPDSVGHRARHGLLERHRARDHGDSCSHAQRRRGEERAERRGRRARVEAARRFVRIGAVRLGHRRNRAPRRAGARRLGRLWRLEAFRWPTGLDRAPKEAKAFYATIAAATAAGVILNFSSIDPIRALFWSAVVNGVVAVPIMAIMMMMAANPKVMGQFTIGRTLKVLGWLSTAALALAAAGMIVLSI